ncbi:hypothetical protein FRC08_009417 [Ceratobasidium sp. 394]|nr:hypothetical protein FRC08_009417 [Ceratobasidium sp. 394]
MAVWVISLVVCGVDDRCLVLAISGERDGLGHVLDPFDALEIDISNTAHSGMLSGLAPNLFGSFDQPEPADIAFSDEKLSKHGELKQASNPCNELAIDRFDVVRSGRLSGLAPHLFGFCDQPGFPDAVWEDIFTRRALGSREATEGTDGVDTQE